MAWATFFIFLAIALAATGFVTWPILRRTSEKPMPRAILAAATALVVLGIGGGAYLELGHPAFATRTLEGTRNLNVDSVIPLLIQRVHRAPGDLQAWVYLGRAYLTVGDSQDAVKAFARALTVAQNEQAMTPALLSAYGEALVQSSGGAVPPAAERAFKVVYAADPKDMGARYYLGLAYAMHGDNKDAIAMWRSLLADSPPNAPWRSELVNRLAGVTAASNGEPDIDAMVEGLAQRLKAHPDDVDGWRRLIRSYTVLGKTDAAKAALSDARKEFAKRADVLAALDADAKALHL